MPFIGNSVQNQGFAPAVDYFNGDGTTVTFTLSRPVASVAQLTAVIENVIQNPASAFTVSGNQITFTSAPPSGTNNVWVEYTSLITQYNGISQDPSVVGDITASGGYLATGDFGNSYLDGTVVDYVTGNARITTGPIDDMTFYHGGTSSRSEMLRLSYAGNSKVTGNLGVGVTPSTNLDVSSTSRYTFNVANSYTLQTSLNAAGNAFADDYKNALSHIWQTSGTERMRIDSSGRVTTPYQPAFQAYCTGSTYITSGQVIPFNNTRFNTGSHFNTSTYRFTAPVAGVYCFQFQGFISNQNTWGNLQIRVSGSLYLYAETQAPYTQSLSPSIVVYLNAGDYVDSYWNTSAGKGFYLGSTESSFSGYLIG